MSSSNNKFWRLKIWMVVEWYRNFFSEYARLLPGKNKFVIISPTTIAYIEVQNVSALRQCFANNMRSTSSPAKLRGGNNSQGCTLVVYLVSMVIMDGTLSADSFRCSKRNSMRSAKPRRGRVTFLNCFVTVIFNLRNMLDYTGSKMPKEPL